jgi:hypothetical protein
VDFIDIDEEEDRTAYLDFNVASDSDLNVCSFDFFFLMVVFVAVAVVASNEVVKEEVLLVEPLDGTGGRDSLIVEVSAASCVMETADCCCWFGQVAVSSSVAFDRDVVVLGGWISDAVGFSG